MATDLHEGAPAEEFDPTTFFSKKEFWYYKMIDKFFQKCPEDKIVRMLHIIDGQSEISLRILDWFVTKYAKKGIDFTRTNGEIFDVHINYKAQLKSYKKRYFDPFRRKKKFDYGFKVNGEDKVLHTTIGQLNFFKWAIGNEIITFVERYLPQITKAMNLSNKEVKRKKSDKEDSDDDDDDDDDGGDGGDGEGDDDGAGDSDGNDIGNGVGTDDGEGAGKDAGKGAGKGAGVDAGKDTGKGAGVDAGKNAGKNAGRGAGRSAGKGAGRGSKDDSSRGDDRASTGSSVSVKKKGRKINVPVKKKRTKPVTVNAIKNIKDDEIELILCFD